MRTGWVGRLNRKTQVVLALVIVCTLALPILVAVAHRNQSHLSLVLVTATADNQPHWGSQITYDVHTSATQYPFVATSCWQGTRLVLSTSAGYFPSYPYPKTKIVTLKSYVWTKGAADCSATLYETTPSGGEKVLKTLSFHVEP
jgi:hypothetical protein